MIEREAKIVNPLGMHVRPAAEFVKEASRRGIFRISEYVPGLS